MRLLFIGDIVGRPGRELVQTGLSALVEPPSTSTSSIANAENAAAGFGITREIGDAVARLGRRRDDVGQSHLGQERGARLHRHRAAAAAAGQLPRRRARQRQLSRAHRATAVSVGVINVMGRVFMPSIDDPFAVVLQEIESVAPARAHRSSWTFTPRRRRKRSRWAGISTARVTAVVGTHTHVQTADERILPKGTAYLTDVGMTGPHDSIIGVEIEPSLGRFLNGLPARFDAATGNPRLNAVIVDADEATGRATDIERLSYSLDELN